MKTKNTNRKILYTSLLAFVFVLSLFGFSFAENAGNQLGETGSSGTLTPLNASGTPPAPQNPPAKVTDANTQSQPSGSQSNNNDSSGNRKSPLLELLSKILLTGNNLVGILIGLSIVYFLWALLSYLKTDSKDGKENSIKVMGFGIIAIFVSISIWGLVNILINSLGVNSSEGSPQKVNVRLQDLIIK